MATIVDFAKCDALGLAELVRSKQVTAAELVEEAIRRIEDRNPRLNAVVYKMYDQARAAAKGDLPDGPFKGVPFLLKDLQATYAGVPTSSGNRLLKNIPMPADSEIVRRFKQAGVIVVGKTNAPEFGITPYTESETLGPAHNPWDLTRTTGGSSGGSAAAVAARVVPMASGGDGGGSIRIPSSCCGIFGFKPTRARTPTGPILGEAWHGFAIEHVLTRSVRDSAAMLDAIAGDEVGAPYVAPPQSRPFLQEVTTEPGILRIAFTSHPFMGHSVHPDCAQGLEKAVLLLQQLGHSVVEAAPKVDGEMFSLAFLTILMSEVGADIEWASSLARRKPAVSDYEAGTYALGMLGKATSLSDYSKSIRYLQGTARSIGRFFLDYDVLLTPTLAEPPFPIGKLQLSGGEKTLIRLVGSINAGWLLKAVGITKPVAAKTFDFIPYTPVFNVTGQPAMSVPLHWNQAGLPIGMHLVGRFGDDATLFRLAGQLERTQPWFDRAPAGFAD